MVLLYIHGFASTGNSSKVEILRALFPNTTVLSPNLSMRPREDFERLQDIVERDHVTTVVATSLGGFYALALAQLYDLRLVVINPAIAAPEILPPQGSVAIYGTDIVFPWNQSEVDQLREIALLVAAAVNPATSTLTWKNVLVLLGAKDDVIPPEPTAAAFPYATVIVDAEADHRFQDISGYADIIRKTAAAPSDLGVPPIEE